jgi:DNA end-binding protein Ku
MPARSLWSGTVSFGLVAIPVGIVTAIRPHRVAFHLLHDEDHARLERKMYCPQHSAFVHPEHIVKGYPIDDSFIVVSQEEIDSLEPERSQTIEITDFVDLDAVDPIYYDRPYYLEPRKGGEKPYSLLARALEKTQKVGIATFVMHDREYLVALRSINGVLCLVTLHYVDDITEPEDIVPADAKPDTKQVNELARKIKNSAADFDPKKYKNDYIEKVRDLLQQKIEQDQIVEAPGGIEEEAEAEEAPDLVAALEESLKKAQKKRKKKTK